MGFGADLAKVQDGYVRLATLQLLAGAPAYQANDAVIAQALAAMGLACSRDQLRAHLGWLEEVRLVSLVDLSALKVAELTERGADVAAGRSFLAGVQRPQPKG